MDDGIARMGEIVYSSPGHPLLRALGLGSCIGLCAYDPVMKLAGLAHIMLPESRIGKGNDVGKYADTAVPELVTQMVKKGATKARLRMVIAGGAQLFTFETTNDRLDVGKRNAEAVKNAIFALKLRLLAEDVGGKVGRTVTFNADTGEVGVKQVGGEEKPLAKLAS